MGIFSILSDCLQLITVSIHHITVYHFGKISSPFVVGCDPGRELRTWCYQPISSKVISCYIGSRSISCWVCRRTTPVVFCKTPKCIVESSSIPIVFFALCITSKIAMSCRGGRIKIPQEVVYDQFAIICISFYAIWSSFNIIYRDKNTDITYRCYSTVDRQVASIIIFGRVVVKRSIDMLYLYCYICTTPYAGNLLFIFGCQDMTLWIVRTMRTACTITGNRITAPIVSIFKLIASIHTAA